MMTSFVIACYMDSRDGGAYASAGGGAVYEEDITCLISFSFTSYQGFSPFWQPCEFGTELVL